MSTFTISDITFAGAYANAVTAAKDSDRQNAGRHVERCEGRNVTGFLATLAQRIAAAMVDMRPDAEQPTSRPA